MAKRSFSIMGAVNLDVTPMKTALKSVEKGIRSVSGSIRGLGGQLGQIDSRLGTIFDTVAGGIDQFADLAKAMTGTGKSTNLAATAMKIFRTALISTGIGALIVALGSLVAYLTSTNEGILIVNTAMEIMGGVVSVIIDRLAILGGAIVKVLKGDFAGAWEDAQKAVDGFGDQIEENIDRAKQIAAEDRDILRASGELRVKEARLTAEIAELREKSRDEERFGAQERAKFIQQAIAKTKELNAARLSLAQRELNLLRERQAQGNNTLEDDKERADLEARVLQIKADQSNQVRTLLRDQKTLTGEVEREAAAVAKIRADRDASIKSIEGVQANVTGGLNPLRGVSTVPTPGFDSSQESDVVARNEVIAGSFRNMGEAITAAMANMTVGLAQGASSLKEFAAGMKRSVVDLVGVVINQLILALLNSLAITFAANPFGFIAITALGGLLAAGAKQLVGGALVPMASGGIVSGPTAVLAGEYAGASGNPEVIAPLDKLRGMLGAGMGMQEVQFKIQGRELVGVLNREGDKDRAF